MNLRIMGGYENTRENKEDFALTPYLFGVWVKEEIMKVFGLGICWGHLAVYIGFGINIPSSYPSFKK